MKSSWTTISSMFHLLLNYIYINVISLSFYEANFLLLQTPQSHKHTHYTHITSLQGIYTWRIYLECVESSALIYRLLPPFQVVGQHDLVTGNNCNTQNLLQPKGQQAAGGLGDGHATKRPPQKATAKFYLECADHDATATAAPNLARKKVGVARHLKLKCSKLVKLKIFRLWLFAFAQLIFICASLAHSYLIKSSHQAAGYWA